MLEFNNCPYRNAPYIGPHSQWIVDIFQKYFGDKTDGFLVEIGVGCVLDWNLMGTPRMLDWEKDEIIRGESHTLELLENGWTGIYIESIHEIMDNEFEPLIKKILPKEQVEKIKIVKCGASDKRRVTRIKSQESLEILPENETEVDTIIVNNPASTGPKGPQGAAGADADTTYLYTKTHVDSSLATKQTLLYIASYFTVNVGRGDVYFENNAYDNATG